MAILDAAPALRSAGRAQARRAKNLLKGLRRSVGTGDLIQSARGLYQPTEHKATPHDRLAEASKLLPHGVVCLLSALHFHDLGKQPRIVWPANESLLGLAQDGKLHPMSMLRVERLEVTGQPHFHPERGPKFRTERALDSA